MFIKRQIVIFPSKEACKNCANFNPQLRCPQQMRNQKCTSFEPLDIGDEELVEEERPYIRESLGSADVGKHTGRPIEPVDEVDAEVVEVEEAVKNA